MSSPEGDDDDPSSVKQDNDEVLQKSKCLLLHPATTGKNEQKLLLERLSFTTPLPVEVDLTSQSIYCLKHFDVESKSLQCIFYVQSDQKTHPKPGQQVNDTDLILKRVFIGEISKEQQDVALYNFLDPSIFNEESFNSTGISLEYEVKENRRLEILFMLDKSRIFENLEDQDVQELIQQNYEKYPERLKVLRGLGGLRSEMNGTNNKWLQADSTSDFSSSDYEKFFSAHKKLKKGNVLKYSLRKNQLNTDLFEYQEKNVQWMISREVTEDDLLNVILNNVVLGGEDQNSPDWFFYKQLGIFTSNALDPSKSENSFLKKFSMKGGILADESGLGKTLQMLSLITSHQKSDQDVEIILEESMDTEEKKGHEDNQKDQILKKMIEEVKAADFEPLFTESKADLNSTTKTVICTSCHKKCLKSVCGWKDDFEFDFICPMCKSEQNHREEIKTTLIVTTDDQIYQWCTEIVKHCSGRLKIMLYFGVSKYGYVQPYEFAKYDVILTTYASISKELGSTYFRRGNRCFLISPLLHVKFWRIIADDYQNRPKFDCCSDLNPKIEAENLWCVTGTPIVKYTSDIVDAFQILSLWPFCFQDYFKCVAQHLRSCPIDSAIRSEGKFLHHTLKSVMIRNTTEEVEHELKLPPLVEITEKIEFSPMEKCLYETDWSWTKRKVLEYTEEVSRNEVLDKNGCERIITTLEKLQNQKIIAANYKFGSYLYSYLPQTIVYKLMYLTKLKAEALFRDTARSMMQVAGINLVNANNEEALLTYNKIFEMFDELRRSVTRVETRLGEEGINLLSGEVGKPGREELELYKEIKRENATRKKWEKEKNMETSIIMMEMREMRMKWFDTKNMPLALEKSRTKRSTGIPVSKKMKKDESDLDSDIEKEVRVFEIERKKEEEYSQTMMALALSPATMDKTMKVELLKNMIEASPGDSVELEKKLKSAIEEALHGEKKHIEDLREELKNWNAIRDEHFNEDIEVLFKKWESEEIPEEKKSFFYMENVSVNENAKTWFRDLSYCINGTIVTNIKNSCPCKEGCSISQRTRSTSKKKSCVLHNIIGRTKKYLMTLAERLHMLENECKILMEILLEMSDRERLLCLLRNETLKKQTERDEQILLTIRCEHQLIKTPWKSESRFVNPQEVPCLVCKMHISVTFLFIEIGERGVFYFAPHIPSVRKESLKIFSDLFKMFYAKKMETFESVTWGPYDCPHIVSSSLQAYANAVLICMACVDQMKELAMADKCITDMEYLRNLEPANNEEGNGDIAALSRRASKRATETYKIATKSMDQMNYFATLVIDNIGKTECSICHEEFTSFKMSSCGHVFCYDCLKLLGKQKIVQAREGLKVGQVECSMCKEGFWPKEAMAAQIENRVIPGIRLTSKVSRAITLIREIIEKDSTSKIIVFTAPEPDQHAWKDLKKIFKLSKLPHTMVKDEECGKLVMDFEASDKKKVIVCPLSFGRKGLNVTSVNHVIFLDTPHIRFDIEQAIGRVHRLGQVREVTVHHLLMRDSADEKFRASAQSQPKELGPVLSAQDYKTMICD